MLNTANLSLEQAPPISIPLRFFLTAPLFGIGAGLCMLFFGPDILLSRWNSITLSTSHLITLGMLAMVMCGAMLQMLPVVAGSPVPGVVTVGTAVHLLLGMGTVFLTVGFVQVGTIWMQLALVALGSGFGLFILGIGIALLRVSFPSYTVTGMRVAVVALAVTVTLGVLLVGGVSGLWKMDFLLYLADIHLGWGVFGWVGLLVIAVSYQVVPMFHVTPEYPLWIRRVLTLSIFVFTVAWSLLEMLGWFGVETGIPSDFVLLALISGFLMFVVLTFRLILRRKRKVPDITLMFWHTGLLSAVVAFAVWLSGRLGGIEYPVLVGLLVLVGCALSLVNGMLYKIVPFLSWFHLQNRQMALMNMSVTVPHMKAFVPDKRAKRQFYLHLAALALMVGAVFFPGWLSQLGGALFALSNLVLLSNLALAVRLYRQTELSLHVSSP
ncbi:MAG: hypothetical protein ABW078_05420 [Sedimenticola sp.]